MPRKWQPEVGERRVEPAGQGREAAENVIQAAALVLVLVLLAVAIALAGAHDDAAVIDLVHAHLNRAGVVHENAARVRTFQGARQALQCVPQRRLGGRAAIFV